MNTFVTTYGKDDQRTVQLYNIVNQLEKKQNTNVNHQNSGNLFRKMSSGIGRSASKFIKR